ncbi:MAG: T9SS type A sorting domain-containing protein [Bacteroidetes bacterium]|nr:MAG: T9SS type A sorting domain-containing protein [Bacteroidota bacterium]
MKRILLLIGAALALSSAAKAQKNVYLTVKHMLGSESFAFNKSFRSSEGDSVKYTRMQYYISGIKLIHDGGQETALSDKYLLVNAGSSDSFSLGQQNITSLEKIRFYIGVDGGVNHGDPAAWPGNHALAPKSPSMHWGWAAGYRFLALEGLCGNGISQAMELHAVGDGLYFETVIATSGISNGSDLSIQLSADYSKAVMGIDLSNGLTRHGDGENETMALLNFVSSVFTSSEGNQSTLNVEKPKELNCNLYPNPSRGQASLSFDQVEERKIQMHDIQGKLALSLTTSDAQVPLNWTKPGMYFITISAGETKKVLTWIVR